MLLCLLSFLFFLLAQSILRNLLVAIVVVGGADILLFILTLAFSRHSGDLHARRRRRLLASL